MQSAPAAIFPREFITLVLFLMENYRPSLIGIPKWKPFDGIDTDFTYIPVSTGAAQMMKLKQ